MNKTSSRALLFTLLLAGAAVSGLVRAADYRIGINAEVSYRESEDEVRHRYADVLAELGKATGNKFTFSPVYSDKVASALADGQFDFLLIHTHLALKAEKDNRFRLVGFTHDRKNDKVHFFVRTDSPVKSLADVAAGSISSPGKQSWATATARATLLAAAPGREPNFKVTRFQDAVPIAVELKVGAVGISRSQKLVDGEVKQGHVRVVYSTPAIPVNAIIAAPGVPPAAVAAVRKAFAGMAGSRAFEPLGFEGLRYSDDEAVRLRAFYGY